MEFNHSVKKDYKPLPIVVVMDTGLNNIPQIKDLIYSRDKNESLFQNLDDDTPDGHGTPMAYLVAYGENNHVPRARVASYKIWSPNHQHHADQGVLKALRKFCPSVTRLFVSSIMFPDENAERIYQQIDRTAQELNAVVVYSAGNIDHDKLQSILKNNKKYPDYLTEHPVHHPARGVSITAVGSVTKYASDKFGIGIVSPFSRCGCGSQNSPLLKCPKPEVAEHGGNLDSDFKPFSPGVKSVNKYGNSATFFGTSFSSPIFIGRIAEIESRYGKQIKNAETLKAIALISCLPSTLTCIGFGEAQTFIGCNKYNALWVFEGSMRLPENLDQNKNSGFNYKNFYWDEIKVEVPPNIKKISMCLVHSDDYQRIVFPSLHTYLRIRAVKETNNTEQIPVNSNYVNRKAHTKIIIWKYKAHSMGGTWKFDIIPESAIYIPSQYRKNVTVRYGCAVLLHASERMIDEDGVTITQWCNNMLRRYSDIDD